MKLFKVLSIALILALAFAGDAFCKAKSPAAPGKAFESSTEYPKDKELEAVLKALNKSQDLGGDIESFEFIKKTGGEYYVFAGDDFAFVGVYGKPENHYVSHLFRAKPGTFKLFRTFERANGMAYILTYEGKRHDSNETGRLYFFLSILDGVSDCNYIDGFQKWDADGGAAPGKSVLRDVRMLDHDRDGIDDIVCKVEPASGGDRIFYVFKNEHTTRGITPFSEWKLRHTFREK